MYYSNVIQEERKFEDYFVEGNIASFLYSNIIGTRIECKMERGGYVVSVLLVLGNGRWEEMHCEKTKKQAEQYCKDHFFCEGEDEKEYGVMEEDNSEMHMEIINNRKKVWKGMGNVVTIYSLFPLECFIELCMCMNNNFIDSGGCVANIIINGEKTDIAIKTIEKYDYNNWYPFGEGEQENYWDLSELYTLQEELGYNIFVNWANK